MKKTIDEVITIMNTIRKKHKKVETNYYYSYNNTNAVFDVMEGEETVIFGIQEKDVYRIFYYSSDRNELIRLLNTTPKGSILDIVAKKDSIKIDWLKDANYFLYNTYGRFGYTLLGYEEQKKKMEQNPIDSFYNENYGEYATASDIEEIQNLIEKGFDKKTDHLFTDAQLLELIQNRNVMVEKENGRIFCVFIYRIEGKKFYCNLTYNEGTADVSYSIEKKTLLKAIQEFGVNYIYSWIALTNKKALKRNGSPEDGVYNYIFEKGE